MFFYRETCPRGPGPFWGRNSEITPGKRPPSDGTWQEIIIGSEPRVGSRRAIGGPGRLEPPPRRQRKSQQGDLGTTRSREDPRGRGTCMGASYSLTLAKTLQLAACKVVLPQTSAFGLGSQPWTTAAEHGPAATPSSWAWDTHWRLCVFISCPVLSVVRSVEHGDVYPPAAPSWG